MDVLNEPILRNSFRKFSMLEHSSENLDFWEQVEMFKKMKPKERRPEAQRIYEMFLKSEEINVSADQSNSILPLKKVIKVKFILDHTLPTDFPSEIFDCLKFETEFNMEDTFSRFRFSNLYKEMSEKYTFSFI
jgi:hypothetical protein